MKHFLCVILGSGSYKYCAESFLFSLVNLSGTEPTKMPLKGTKKTSMGFSATVDTGQHLEEAMTCTLPMGQMQIQIATAI